MNLKSLLIGTALITIPFFSTTARADENVPEGVIYKGGDYTVYVVRDSYRGCDAQKRCLNIPHAFSQSQTATVWKNSGYTYTMSKLHSSSQNSQDRRLKVVSPKGKVILNVVMKLYDIFN